MSKQTKAAPVILSKATPSKSADIFRAAKRPHLLNQQDEWLDYDGRAYVLIEDATIESEIKRFTDHARVVTIDAETGEQSTSAFNPKSNDRVEIYKALKSACHVPANTRTPPCWLHPSGSEPRPRHIIACENGLLDITTGKLHPHTPEFFTRTALPIVYDPLAPIPRKFLRFLLQIMDGRKPLIWSLQEQFGYLISGATSLQKVLFWWGRPRSGKSTLLRIATDLIGSHNVYSPSMQNLANEFGLQDCIGKSLITITDMDCDNKSHVGQAAANINRISGEDMISANRKTKAFWTGTLPGRIVMAGNNLPNFGGRAVALGARMILTPFDVSFLGREDQLLTAKLRKELSGILNWAIAGLARLRARGYFKEPPESVTAKSRMLHASEPVRGFVDECCTIEIDARVDKSTLYPIYREYCIDTGAPPMPIERFSERLHEIYAAVVPSKRRTKSDGRRPVFAGIRLNDGMLMRKFKLDPDLYALGAEGAAALLLDMDGEPLPRGDFAD